MPLDPSRRVAWCAWGIFAVALLVVPFACAVRDAQAGPRSQTVFDCGELAQGLGAYAVFRDLDANLEKVIAEIKRRGQGAPPARVAVIERELRRIWAGSLTQEQTENDVYRRCKARFGEMGGEGV